MTEGKAPPLSTAGWAFLLFAAGAFPAAAQTTDISITKTDGVASVTPGTALTYTIVLTNNGPAGVMASVSDIFPASLTAVSWTCNPSGAAGSSCLLAPFGTGNIGNGAASLPVGGAVTFTVHATVAPSATGSLSNTANAGLGAGVSDPDLSNNSATDADTLTPSADVSVTLAAPGSAAPGGTVTFTATVLNNGPSDAAGVVLTEPTPPGLVFSGNTGGCVTAFPCALGAIPAGQTVIVSTLYSIPGGIPAGSGPTITATAAVTAATPDPVPANNVATAVSPFVVPVPAATPVTAAVLAVLLAAGALVLLRARL